jgi:deazaflavin-dependent oxidoreductase (nitroreductase family)
MSSNRAFVLYSHVPGTESRLLGQGLGIDSCASLNAGGSLAVRSSEVVTVRIFDASHPIRRPTRPVLGLRRTPGRLALFLFRLPLPLYRTGWGWLLGHTFLVLDHAGRKTGQLHSTAAMVLSYDPQTQEAVICSVWGQDTDWIRNIRVRAALQVQIGRESFAPEQRFLSADESFAVAVEFRRRHPGRLCLLTQVLGWDDLRSDSAVREFVHTRPFVAFRPAPRPEPPVA